MAKGQIVSGLHISVYQQIIEGTMTVLLCWGALSTIYINTILFIYTLDFFTWALYSCICLLFIYIYIFFNIFFTEISRGARKDTTKNITPICSCVQISGIPVCVPLHTRLQAALACVGYWYIAQLIFSPFDLFWRLSSELTYNLKVIHCNFNTDIYGTVFVCVSNAKGWFSLPPIFAHSQRCQEVTRLGIYAVN